jgi:hypothetical protein
MKRAKSSSGPDDYGGSKLESPQYRLQNDKHKDFRQLSKAENRHQQRFVQTEGIQVGPDPKV